MRGAIYRCRKGLRFCTRSKCCEGLETLWPRLICGSLGDLEPLQGLRVTSAESRGGSGAEPAFSLCARVLRSRPPERQRLKREGEPTRVLVAGFTSANTACDRTARLSCTDRPSRPCRASAPRPGPSRRSAASVAFAPAYWSSDVLYRLFQVDLRVAIPRVLVGRVVDDEPRGVGAEAVLVLQKGDPLLPPLDAGVIGTSPTGRASGRSCREARRPTSASSRTPGWTSVRTFVFWLTWTRARASPASPKEKRVGHSPTLAPRY